MKELQELEKKFNVDLSSCYNVYPVPVGDICEKLGIDVIFDKNMSNDIHGEISYNNNKFVININDNHSIYNNIFTTAHEIGHYLKHHEEVKKTGFSDGIKSAKKSITRIANIKDQKCDEETRKMETEANDFAANLLMPKEKFTEVFLETNGDLQTLEKYFRVSKTAIQYRALNLGLMTAY